MYNFLIPCSSNQTPSLRLIPLTITNIHWFHLYPYPSIDPFYTRENWPREVSSLTDSGCHRPPIWSLPHRGAPPLTGQTPKLCSWHGISQMSSPLHFYACSLLGKMQIIILALPQAVVRITWVTPESSVIFGHYCTVLFISILSFLLFFAMIKEKLFGKCSYTTVE